MKELSEAQAAAWITSLFLFALVWSLGGNTDDEGRKRFDTALRCVTLMQNIVLVWPTSALMELWHAAWCYL